MDRPRPVVASRRAVLIGSALVLLATIAYALSLAFTGRTVRVEAARLSIATVEQGIFRDVTALRATVVPRDVVVLDAQEGGRVDRVLAQVGDLVSEGQPLVHFGNTDLQLQVIEREARLIEQVNNLRSIETALEQSRAANERALEEIRYNIARLRRLGGRVSSLAETGATSAESSESLADELAYYERLQPIVAGTAKRQEALRVRRLPEIDEGLGRLLLNLDIVRSKLDSLVVRAPVAGRLTSFDLRVGENRERGSRIAEIVPDTGFRLEAFLDEFYLGRLRTGQQAEVGLDAARYTLRVTRVDPQVREGRIRIELEFTGDTPENLVAGQSMQGHLQLGSNQTALVLPAGAFLEETGGRWAFVIEPDGRTARRRDIEPGRRSSEQVEVLRGLAAGERVIVSGYSELRDAEVVVIDR